MKQQKKDTVTTCGCCNQGDIDMKAEFEKEFFYRNEVADCKVKGDLSEVKINCNAMRF